MGKSPLSYMSCLAVVNNWALGPLRLCYNLALFQPCEDYFEPSTPYFEPLTFWPGKQVYMLTLSIFSFFEKNLSLKDGTPTDKELEDVIINHTSKHDTPTDDLLEPLGK